VAYVFAVLFLAVLSPITGVSWRVLLCAFPLIAVAGARVRGGWFLAGLGASALAMAAVALRVDGRQQPDALRRSRSPPAVPPPGWSTR